MKNTLTSISISLIIGLMALSLPAVESFFLDSSQQWQPMAQLPDELQNCQLLIDQGKYKKAIKRLKAWSENPDNNYQDYALFMQGNAQFNRERYYQAFLAYDQLINHHGTSVLFEPTLRKEVEIARRFLAGAKRIVWGFIPASARYEALEILDRVAQSWPGSDLAAQAIMMQANHYFAREKYLKAKDSYQLIMDNYPRSSYYPIAMQRMAESCHYQFNDVEYDASCLIEAQVFYHRFQNQFPDRAAAENIQTRLDAIASTLIEKEYEIAAYYHRTDKPEAALYYWTHIEKTWPNSGWAVKAAQKREQYESAN